MRINYEITWLSDKNVIEFDNSSNFSLEKNNSSDTEDLRLIFNWCVLLWC